MRIKCLAHGHYFHFDDRGFFLPSFFYSWWNPACAFLLTKWLSTWRRLWIEKKMQSKTAGIERDFVKYTRIAPNVGPCSCEFLNWRHPNTILNILYRYWPRRSWNITFRWTAKSYIFPRGYIFPKRAALRENIYNYLGTTDLWYFIRPGQYLLY